MADRTVTTRLVAKVSEYVAGLKEADRATKGVTEDLVDAAKAGKKLGADGAAGGIEAAAGFKVAESAAKKLDRQIADVKDSIARLRAEAHSTGDLGLVKDIQAQEKALRELMSQRKSLGEQGRSGASAFVDGLVDGLHGAMSATRLGPELGPPLIAAIAGASPFIISAIGGAVTTGVALASVGAGLKIAFTDPTVKAAGQSLATDIGAELKDAAKPFVPATKAAIEQVRSEFQSLKPDLDAIFADSARYVGPLTTAATGFVHELTPGLREANANAQPLIEVLGQHGPQAGAAFGSALRDMSKDADTAAQSLDGLLTGVEMTITSTGKMVEFVNKVYPWLGPGLLPWIGALDNTHNQLRHVAAASGPAADGVKNVGDKAAGAKQPVMDLNTALSTYQSEALGLWGANRDMEAAIDAGTAALKTNGATLDANTPKGRANQEALAALAKASESVYDKTLLQTGSQDDAEAAAKRGRDAFIALATKMYGSASAAQALADKLFGIPSPKVSISVHDQQALDAARAVQQSLGQIKDVHAGIYLTTHGSAQGYHLGTGTQLKRWGGITEHAADGLLREAQVASPMAPARYGWAEPETGGEAFIPKYGNAVRSMAILDKAASWYGATVRPQANAGGAGTVTTINVAVSVPATANPAEVGRVVVEQIRAYEQRSGTGWRR